MTGMAIFPCKYGCVHDPDADAFLLAGRRRRLAEALRAKDSEAELAALRALEREEKRQAEHAAYHAPTVPA